MAYIIYGLLCSAHFFSPISTHFLLSDHFFSVGLLLICLLRIPYFHSLLFVFISPLCIFRKNQKSVLMAANLTSTQKKTYYTLLSIVFYKNRTFNKSEIWARRDHLIHFEHEIRTANYAGEDKDVILTFLRIVIEDWRRIDEFLAFEILSAISRLLEDQVDVERIILENSEEAPDYTRYGQLLGAIIQGLNFVVGLFKAP
jgi:hypothetical protein